MSKVLGAIGAMAGSAIGWWIGGHVGVMTAFLFSVCGTGLGMYAGVKVARQYLG